MLDLCLYLTRNAVFIRVIGTYILRVFVCRALTESLVTPMQGKMEDFKKLTTQLDKEHNKGDYICDSIGRVFASR